MTQPQPLIAHLIELRGRLLRAVLCVLIIFLSLAYFAQDLYQILSRPLIDALPVGAQMIATDVASPFFAPFKLTLVVSFFIAIPFVLFQCWAFVAPALYKRKALGRPLDDLFKLAFLWRHILCVFRYFPSSLSFFRWCRTGRRCY